MIRKESNLTLKLALFTWMLSMFFSYSAFSDQQKLTNDLDSLMSILGIPHHSDFNSMTSASQVWRRSPAQERWQLPDIKIDPPTHTKAMKQLRLMGLVDEAKPIGKEFDYVILLGATVPRMQRRLEYLANLWQDGVRYKRLIFLVGQRPLDAKIDQVDQLIANTSGHLATPGSKPITETEGAVMLFQSTHLMPEMRAVPVNFVDSPRHWNETYWQRPNTRDTLQSWLRYNPRPGSVLVMSDQPHGLYQSEVVRQELPESFTIELAAQAADRDTRMVIYLDALALWLHNLQQAPQHPQPANPSATAPSKITIPPTRH